MTVDLSLADFPKVVEIGPDTEQKAKMIQLRAVVVPGVGGQFEAKVVAPDEIVLKLEASRNGWFTQDELDAFESFINDVAERKGRPKLRVVGG